MFYAIGGPAPGSNLGYTAALTRVQFRGLFTKNGFRDFGHIGIDITGALKVLAAAGGLTINLPGSWIPFVIAVTELDAQGFLDGNWLPAAAKVADKIGAEMAKQNKIPKGAPPVEAARTPQPKSKASVRG